MGRSSSELSNLNEDWDSGMKMEIGFIFFINKKIYSLRQTKIEILNQMIMYPCQPVSNMFLKLRGKAFFLQSHFKDFTQCLGLPSSLVHKYHSRLAVRVDGHL